jgi:hypothetical protein
MLWCMTRDMIIQLWESEGAKLSGQSISVREEREATCFVETTGDVMSIGRVTKLELRDAFITLQTAKEERFIFAYDDVLGFKLSSPSTTKDRPPAGFGR